MRTAWTFLVATGLMLSVSLTHADAQTPWDLEAIKKQIEALAAGQHAIEAQLREIRALLQAQTKPLPVAEVLLNVDGAPSKGEPRAKLTVVEFSDYECPFCARYARETWPLLEREYVKTAKVKYVFRDFPLPTLHKQAMKAHEAAHCAGEQSKYWDMHDLLFANSPAIGRTALIDYAARAGFPSSAFERCLDSGKHITRIRQDIIEGQRAGVSGTPTFFLGVTPSNGAKMQVLTVLRGAQSFAAFRQAIDRLLASNAGSSPQAPRQR